MSMKTNVQGAVMDLGDRQVVVPGLSLAQVKANKALITAFINSEQELATKGAISALDSLETAAQIILLALSRNYGDTITLEMVEAAVDMNTLQLWVQTIMGQSGFKLTREVPMREAVPGEAQRVG